MKPSPKILASEEKAIIIIMQYCTCLGNKTRHTMKRKVQKIDSCTPTLGSLNIWIVSNACAVIGIVMTLVKMNTTVRVTCTFEILVQSTEQWLQGERILYAFYCAAIRTDNLYLCSWCNFWYSPHTVLHLSTSCFCLFVFSCCLGIHCNSF